MDDRLQISDLLSLNHSLSELTSFHSLGKWLELLISLIVFFSYNGETNVRNQT